MALTFSSVKVSSECGGVVGRRGRLGLKAGGKALEVDWPPTDNPQMKEIVLLGDWICSDTRSSFPKNAKARQPPAILFWARLTRSGW